MHQCRYHTIDSAHLFVHLQMRAGSKKQRGREERKVDRDATGAADIMCCMQQCATEQQRGTHTVAVCGVSCGHLTTRYEYYQGAAPLPRPRTCMPHAFALDMMCTNMRSSMGSAMSTPGCVRNV